MDKIKDVLTRSLEYIKWANHTAEARHDNPEGEYYMDGGQYEIMQETEKLIDEIDTILAGLSG